MARRDDWRREVEAEDEPDEEDIALIEHVSRFRLKGSISKAAGIPPTRDDAGLLRADTEDMDTTTSFQPGPAYKQASSRIRNKAITAGQRAGQRAFNNVFDAFQRAHGYITPPREVYARADEAARVASHRAIERHCSKALGLA